MVMNTSAGATGWLIQISVLLSMQLTVRKTRPPLVTVAMTDKQWRSHTTHMFSRSEKYIAEQRGNWQHTDREDRAGYFWYETRSQDPQLLNCHF